MKILVIGAGQVGAPPRRLDRWLLAAALFAKAVIRLMWAGRREIIPVAVLLTRRYWRA